MNDIKRPDTPNPTVIHPVDPAIEQYLAGLTGSTDHPVLSAMEERARDYSFPIVGRLVGIFLETMARAIDARRVFEFGSGFGYSAYWFARAVGLEGQVFCTDGNGDNLNRARTYLTQAQLWDRVKFAVGNAQQLFGDTEGKFDICYNDVDKGDYPEIWQLARERIRPGGLYIADNVLWHGRVTMENPVDVFPGWTEAILEHNRLIFADPEFDAFVNPVRDGVIVARRKG